MNFKFSVLFLLIFILLTSISIMAAPEATPAKSETLSADSPAVAMSWGEKALAFLGTLLTFIVGLIAKLSKPLIPHLEEWLKSLIKGLSHNKGVGVVADSFSKIFGNAAENLRQKLLDGKLTEQERKDFIAEVKADAKPKLENLYGFAKKNLEDWVEDQISIRLGKFLLLNSNSSGSNTP